MIEFLFYAMNRLVLKIFVLNIVISIIVGITLYRLFDINIGPYVAISSLAIILLGGIYSIIKSMRDK
jgi:hypothetical protein